MKTLQDSERSEDIRGAVALLIFCSIAIWSILCDWHGRAWFWLTVPMLCGWRQPNKTIHRAPLKFLGRKPSHGMCQECADKMKAQVRAMTKAK